MTKRCNLMNSCGLTLTHMYVVGGCICSCFGSLLFGENDSHVRKKVKKFGDSQKVHVASLTEMCCIKRRLTAAFAVYQMHILQFQLEKIIQP